MSDFFRNFPRTFYKFGNETSDDQFEDLSRYSDVIDQTRDQLSFYQDYYIQPGERPDQASFKLYGTSEHHWTFFLMNEKLREQGWPLSLRQVDTYGTNTYTHTVLTTRTKIYDKFKVGQTMNGLTSGAEAVIVKRNLDLGQLWIEGIPSVAFINGESITSTNADGVLETIVLNGSVIQKNAVHHYEYNNEHIDVSINESTGDYEDPGAEWTPITWQERLNAQNDTLRQIRVLQPNVVESVSQSFKEAVAT